MPDGRCAFWFYMSTDYLPDGWRVLTAPVAEPVLTLPQPPQGEDRLAPLN